MSYPIPSRASDAGPSPLRLYDRDEDGFPCLGLPNDGDGPKCQNCGALSETLTMLGDGWDYLACPACADEAEPLALPLPLPAARELRVVAAREGA